jgi:phosphatidylserine decarboxylase
VPPYHLWEVCLLNGLLLPGRSRFSIGHRALAQGTAIRYLRQGGESIHCVTFRLSVIDSFVPKKPFDFESPSLQINLQLTTTN